MDTATFEDAQARLLARYGIEARSHFIAVPGPVERVHVLEAGSGPPLLLVHGGGSFAAHWAPLMAELDGYRVVAVDRPGHGLSGAFTYPRDLDVRRHAVDFLADVMDTLELERCPLVGNSMGGLWSFWFALDRPERVSAVVQLGCPAVLLETGAPLGLRLVTAPMLGRILLALEPPSRRQVLRLLRRLGDRRPADRPTELVEAFAAAEPLFAQAWLSLLRRFTGPLRRRDVSLGADELRTVSQPVHLVWGEHDPFGGRDVGARAATLLPHGTIDVLPAGHLPWIELPAQVGEIVRAFLTAHGSPTLAPGAPLAAAL
jgi:pimeloyl-ACP methyl ester carboxylesterase